MRVLGGEGGRHRDSFRSHTAPDRPKTAPTRPQPPLSAQNPPETATQTPPPCQVVAVTPDVSAIEAMALMNDSHISAVAVVDSVGKIIGGR